MASFIFLFVIAFFMGYIYGYRIKPNRRLRNAVLEVRASGIAALEEGRKGVYKTIVMDGEKTSELVVELKELAVTELGQAKVQYISAYYKNPEFRNRKGDALLQEIHDLLGDYLPLHEIEWYESNAKKDQIKNHLTNLESKYKKYIRA